MTVSTLKRIAIAAAVAIVIAGCGGSSHKPYPVNAQTNFLNSCEQTGGGVSYCQCILNWFEGHKSFTEFLADEDEIRTGGTPADAKTALRGCRN